MEVYHPRMLTRMALIYLEEAVLDVLLKAGQDDGGLDPEEIGKLIGIPSSSKRLEGIANPIVRGILDRLESERFVRQTGAYQPWQLTEKGIEHQLAKIHANIR